MANEEHLKILMQGVDAWNRWRQENLGIQVDLSKTNLYKVHLFGADLHMADLSYTDLTAASLIDADLSEANLAGADLTGANLFRANLTDASAIESRWFLTNATAANLRGADLSGADLLEANFNRADLAGTDFARARSAFTIFTDIDLSCSKHLHSVRHNAPSSVGVDTIHKSKGNIPHEFLEGCGVPEMMIAYAKSLSGMDYKYYTCFISHSFKDSAFCHKLYESLKGAHLQVYYAPEKMKGGQKIYEQLYEAIYNYDKLILVLSEASINSNWVQTEIKRARKHEREDKRRKLFPISIVSFQTIQNWELFDSDEGRDLAHEIREYYIPDFTNWEDYDKFNEEFEKLLEALRADS